MIDKSKQLVLRVDLYFSYVLLVACFIAACEVPLLAIWIGASRYLMPVGWLILLTLAIRRMWAAKTEHDLTSDLQVYKIVVLLLLALAISSVVWAMGIHGPEHTNQLGLVFVIKLAFLVNAMAGIDACVIGILTLYVVEKVNQ
jgi:hypothetical protein